MSAEVVSLFPKEVPPLMRLAVTAALLRYQFQLFDNGGESMRSIRSKLGEEALRLTESLVPGHRKSCLQAAYAACEDNPTTFLISVERTNPLHPDDRKSAEAGDASARLQYQIQQTAVIELMRLLRRFNWPD